MRKTLAGGTSDAFTRGKKALVTGGTAGTGQAIAEAFGREGARVIVVGRNEQRGKQVAETMRSAGGSATFLAADLTSKAAVDQLVKAADETSGLVDILVNNAGIYPLGPTAQVDEATFDAVIATNLKGPFFLTAALLPRMAARLGQGKKGAKGARAASGYPHRDVCRTPVSGASLAWQLQGIPAICATRSGRSWPP